MKFLYKKTAGITKNQEQTTLTRLKPYISRLLGVSQQNTYDYLEASINCPFDKTGIKEVKAMIKEKTSKKLKYVVVIGIGGSNLGTKAVYDALRGQADTLSDNSFIKMIFIDTVNTSLMHSFENFLKKEVLSLEEILICSISKSGGTAETIANTEMVMELASKYVQKDMKSRLVVITDQNSSYWNEAVKKDIAVLSIPDLVGGRYSVLSPVGLFPLGAAGLDIDALLSGAREMRERCITKTVTKNIAAISATILYHQHRKKRVINDNFIFHPQLESVGKWYRQLMGESVGKEKNKQGKVVNIGITPIVSIGSTDLHSVGQLYLGGPKDKITTFIYAKKGPKDISVPKKRLFGRLVPMITKKTADDILTSILSGVKVAYKKKRLPYMEVELDDISEKSIGAFFQFKMIEMMYLGFLLKVNVFDQPNVESYKIETKKILKKK